MSSASIRADEGVADLPRAFDVPFRRVDERVAVAVAMRGSSVRSPVFYRPRGACPSISRPGWHSDGRPLGRSDGFRRAQRPPDIGMLVGRRKDVPVLLRCLLTAAVALSVAACGDDPDRGEGLEQVEPTAACAEAFAGAVPATEDPTIPSDDEEDDTAVTDREIDTVSLARLEPTLGECEDVEDWLAGAREHRGAIPNELDGIAALRFACDALEADTTVCQQVSVPEDIDDAGVEDPATSSP